MSVATMQNVIARLCVDISFRKSFINDPDKTLGSYPLSCDEIESIKALDISAVRDYASSLVGKRSGLIRKWFELSICCLEKALSPDATGRILIRYGVENIRNNQELGGEWVLGESERFARFLQRLVAERGIEISYFADLVEFDLLRSMMPLDPAASADARTFKKRSEGIDVAFTGEFTKSLRPLLGRHARIATFKYDVSKLVEEIEKGNVPAHAEERLLHLLFLKKPGARYAVTLSINDPLKSILDLCNGELTIDEIVSAFASSSPEFSGTPLDQLTRECCDALHELYKVYAITFLQKPNSESQMAGTRN